MFIYKITIIPLNQVYIGLDTKPSYKLSRWKKHQEIAKKNPKTKLHRAMASVSPSDCIIEIIEDGFTSIGKLALAEILYIEQFDSYKNGLNSTPGGDGLGVHNLSILTTNEILEIKKALGDRLRDYNKNAKWADTGPESRKEKTKHLHTEEVYQKKSNGLKEFYKANPTIKKKKGEHIKQWQADNLDAVRAQNKINSLKGAEKVSKKLMIELESGEVLYYPSKSEFQRKTGQWASTILKKTKEGKFHNGYKATEI